MNPTLFNISIRPTMADLINTIKNSFEKSGKFILCPHIKNRNFLKFRHQSSEYTDNYVELFFHENKITIKYPNREMYLHFSEPIESVIKNMSNYIEGFMLMIITGFTFEVVPIFWNKFYFFAKCLPLVVNVNYNANMEILFENNNIPYKKLHKFNECIDEIYTFITV
jgi:hypothetical protein